MSIEVIMTILVALSVLGIYLFTRLIISYYKMRDGLKRISKPLTDKDIPRSPVSLSIESKPNQTFNGKAGKHIGRPRKNGIEL
jgi:hypothetical protein